MRIARLAVALPLIAASLGLVADDARAKNFNWDSLGEAFCAATVSGDMSRIAPLLSSGLANAISGVAGRGDLQPPRTLFQTYANEVSACSARTLNAALVEITRSNAGGASPSWREYLVIVPEGDGMSRIDDVLFATRRSDTLRARLKSLSR